jgi:hypothetical protein
MPTGGQVIFTDTAPPNTAVTVTVAVANGQQLAGALAAIVDLSGNALPNPITTSATGVLTFYALPGQYTLEFQDGENTVAQPIWLDVGPGWQPSPFVGDPE